MLFMTKLKKRLRWTWHRLYPWTGLNGLDKRLVETIGDPRGGFFVEAGANDGIRQSNTHYLARRRGWQGLLVEPVPSLAADCAKNRPESTVVNCALVSFADEGCEIEIVDVDLMSMVRRHDENAEPVIAMAESVQGIKRKSLNVVGRSLSGLLDEVESRTIDLLSLDVEGYELQVFAGLDLSRHSPRWILVETKDVDAVRAVLEETHELITSLSYHDYLFRQRVVESDSKSPD